MSKRATIVHLDANPTHAILAGDPILDTKEGVLIIAFDDGTSRVYNWDYVIDYYTMTEAEYDSMTYESEV